MREAAVELPLADALARRRRARSTRSPREAAGRAASARACSAAQVARAPARPRALRRHRLGAGRAVRRRCRRSQRGVRGGVPPALRLPDAASGALIVEAVSVEAVGAGDAPAEPRHATSASRRAAPVAGDACACSAAAAGATPRWSCATTRGPATSIDGPAIIAEKQCDHRRRARLAGARHRARPPGAGARRAARGAPAPIGTTVDPVMLEVFNNLFMNIAEQMGLQLQNTAYSVNIKERLDFSCALFDADGNLIANAPHMPVHLGSMSEIDQDGDRAQRRHDAAGRRLRAERSVPRRHAPARRDRGHAGVPATTASDEPCSTSARAATMPTSAAPRPARCRRSRRASRKRACRSTTSSWSTAAACARPRCWRCCASGALPVAQPGAEHRRPEGADRRQREGRAGAAQRWSTQFGLDVVQAYMRHVQDNAEESVRRVITR